MPGETAKNPNISGFLRSRELGDRLGIVLWIRAKTIGEDERGNAERRALFVGLWPPMFWLMGDALRRTEAQQARRGLFRRG